MRRTHATIGLLAAGALVLAACSSNDGKAGDNPSGPVTLTINV